MNDYWCPCCDDLVRVYYGTWQIKCPHCATHLLVERDAEVVDGEWKDRTLLIPIGEITDEH